MNKKALSFLAAGLAVTGCALMPLKAFKKADKEAAGKQVASQSSERRKPADWATETAIAIEMAEAAAKNGTTAIRAAEKMRWESHKHASRKDSVAIRRVMGYAINAAEGAAQAGVAAKNRQAIRAAVGAKQIAQVAEEMAEKAIEMADYERWTDATILAGLAKRGAIAAAEGAIWAAEIVKERKNATSGH